MERERCSQELVGKGDSSGACNLVTQRLLTLALIPPHVHMTSARWLQGYQLALPPGLCRILLQALVPSCMP